MSVFKKLLKNKNGDTLIPYTGVDDDYSTTEKDTGHTWVDGTKIYKRTVHFQRLELGVNNVSANARVYLVKAEGFMYQRASSSSHWNFPYVSTSGGAGTILSVEDSGSISNLCLGTWRVDSSFDWTAWGAYVTYYYTKGS